MDNAPPAATGISEQVFECCSAFNSLLECLHLQRSNGSNRKRMEDIQYQYDRFMMWAGNIGAHKQGQSSLEYRLRDASHMREAVVQMLTRLVKVLIDSESSLHENEVPVSRSSEPQAEMQASSKFSTKNQVLTHRHDLSNITEDDFDALLGDPDLNLEDILPMSVSETIQNVLSFVSDTVGSLLRMAMAIRNPAPQDRYLAASKVDTSFYESYDIDHVRTLYADAPEYLSCRLGRANTARRQFLKYSKDHRTRLASGIVTLEHGDTQSTVATSLPAKFKRPEVDWTQVDHRDDVSQTTINTSAPGTQHLDVIPFPAGATYDEEFECPLCFCIVLIRDWNQWKSHQFHDLQPYICTYEDCITGSRLYGARRDWRAHLATHDDQNQPATVRRHCALCKQSLAPRELYDHLCREMQELSLFAVPSELFDSHSDLEDLPPKESKSGSEDSDAPEESEIPIRPSSEIAEMEAAATEEERLEEEEWMHRLRMKKEQEKSKKKETMEDLHKKRVESGLLEEQIQPVQRPTYIKVARKHLDIETLKYYNLRYEIDRADPEYIIILEEIDEDETETLFEHTRKLRSDSRSLLVRKRSKGRDTSTPPGHLQPAQQSTSARVRDTTKRVSLFEDTAPTSSMAEDLTSADDQQQRRMEIAGQENAMKLMSKPRVPR